MPRFTSFLSIESILLLATLVASTPTGLHAQANSQPSKPGANGNKQEITQPQTTPAQTGTQPGTDKPKQPATQTKIETPTIEVVNLVLNLKQKRVYVYKGDKIVAKYPVAIGKKGWETPVGEWQVMQKVRNPAWTNFKTGEVMKAGRENPLGSRWIGFWTDGQDVIGFHGTPNIKSIGTAASHGCVRMYNRDVRALYPLVKVGTTVKVVAQ